MACNETKRCGGTGCPHCDPEMIALMAMSPAERCATIKRQQEAQLRGLSMRHSACSNTGCGGCERCTRARHLGGVPPPDQAETNRKIAEHNRRPTTKNQSTAFKREQQALDRAKRDQVEANLRDGVPEVQ